MEAIKIHLIDAPKDAKIKYSIHVKDLGWQPAVYDGEQAGTTGEERRAEAIKVELENVPDFSVQYRVHMKDTGWSEWACDGEQAGTTGESRRIEAIEVRLLKK